MKNFNFLIVSETGLARVDNQDSFFVSEQRAVFCVADGVGGGSAGAKASGIVCEEIRKALEEKDNVKQSIEIGIVAANRRIRQYAQDKKYTAMGTTAVVLAFDENDGNRVDICHIGDSRVYKLANNRTLRLTDDHTLANRILHSGDAQWTELIKGRNSPLCHILTKAVGADDEISLEWRSANVQVGDCFLICSDGVHDVVDEDGLSRLFNSSNTLEDFSCTLRTEIYKCGAPDNFTYIIIKIGE